MLPETPKFWSGRNWLSTLLLPFSWIYLAGHRVKTFLTKPYTSPLPVLCIGGVVAGGSGKTPVTHAMLAFIREQNLFQSPVILTRGYGGKLRGPTFVDAAIHGAQDVGDEALLHAIHAPTIVSRDRASGARLAEASGADIIIMDDGLQNNSLTKTLSFLVIDGTQGIGNGRLLPAGPLREPVDEALKKCAAVIQTNGKSPLHFSKPVLATEMSVVSGHDKSKTYFGFCGLGHPEKFRRTLVENGFTLTGFKPYSDHYPYKTGDMDELLQAANGARLITTEKDFMRVPQEYRDMTDILRISQNFTEPEALALLLKDLT